MRSGRDTFGAEGGATGFEAARVGGVPGACVLLQALASSAARPMKKERRASMVGRAYDER